MAPEGADTGNAELAADVAGIARILLAPGPLPEVLERVVSLALSTISGCEHAGTCSLPDEIPSVGASTPLTRVVDELDSLQSKLGEVPCVDVSLGQASVYASDLALEQRWPRFAARAVEGGLRSVLAYRLFAGEQKLGALHLYARTPEAFDSSDRAQGLLFAAHAGLALSVAQSRVDDRVEVDQLQTALVSRDIIGQAQGILMERARHRRPGVRLAERVLAGALAGVRATRPRPRDRGHPVNAPADRGAHHRGAQHLLAQQGCVRRGRSGTR